MSFNLHLAGHRELVRKLEIMNNEISDKIVKNALKKGSQVISDAMKSAVSPFKITMRGKKNMGVVYTDQDLRNSIGAIKRKGDGLLPYYAVGPKISKKDMGFLGVWLELGTLAKRTEPTKRKRSKGAAAAAARGFGLKKAPFARPGYEKSKDSAMKTVADELKSGLASIK